MKKKVICIATVIRKKSENFQNKQTCMMSFFKISPDRSQFENDIGS